MSIITNEIWFDAGVWDLIKEYAGIYNFAIKWNFKMTTNHFWVSDFVNCFDGLSEAKYKKLGEDMIRRMFWKDINAGMHLNSWSKLPQIPQSRKIEALVRFEKQFNDFKPPADLKVGDIVRFDPARYNPHFYGSLTGRVCKINAKSFTVEAFKPNCVDSTAIYMAESTDYWLHDTNTIMDKHIVKSNKWQRDTLKTYTNERGIVYHFQRNISY